MVPGIAIVALAGLMGVGPRFDLICSVTDYDGSFLEQPLHVRVDLDRRAYCLDDCREASPIAEISARTIVLYDGSDGGRHHARVTIDRGGGNIVMMRFFRGSHRDRSGYCEVKTFTSLPALRR